LARFAKFSRSFNEVQVTQLQPGDAAPDFTLPASDGKLVSLSDFQGRSEVVLFFYPKDNTPGCTREACSFRDNYAAFRDASAEVIGISSDSGESHQQFAQRFRLPFVLLSDHDGTVRARYGVAKTLGILPGRATFLIDRKGIIRLVFASQFQPAQHVARALRVLKELRAQT
jgi:peroxiredoxin Q/BCP